MSDNKPKAKTYLKRHQSEMEERLAQDKTFFSRLKQTKLWVIKLMQVFKINLKHLVETYIK